jgi:hypothetical protein
MTFDLIVADMPLAAANSKAPHFNYTLWHLVEHMRIAQHDILEFILDPDYQSPPWPEGFWPAEEQRVDQSGWQHSLSQYRRDLQRVRDLIEAPATDFFAPIAHAADYTIFRQILLLADHNAYHLGELITLRQVLKQPPPEKW